MHYGHFPFPYGILRAMGTGAIQSESWLQLKMSQHCLKNFGPSPYRVYRVLTSPSRACCRLPHIMHFSCKQLKRRCTTMRTRKPFIMFAYINWYNIAKYNRTCHRQERFPPGAGLRDKVSCSARDILSFVECGMSDFICNTKSSNNYRWPS